MNQFTINNLKEQISDYEYQLLSLSVELDDFYNNTPIGYLTIDESYKIISANITILDVLKYSKRALQKLSSILEIIKSEEREEFSKTLESILSGQNIKNFEINLVSSGNSVIPVYLTNKIISVPNSNLKTIRFTVIDISEKKIIEGNLAAKTKQVIHQNFLMKNDLALASRIQKSLLPKQNSMSNISTLYIPLEEVGGDFYDFIRFRDANRVGVFISDVAGHGIASAFITAIIKSTIHQMPREVLEDPGEFLTLLNDAVIDFSDNRFVTASYAIIDFDSKIMKFADAGHPHPYIFSEYGISNLLIRNKRKPLGIIDSNILRKKGKVFTTEHYDLKDYDKILFFTDGLTEASIDSDDGSPIFYEDELEKFLKPNQFEKSKDLIDNILVDLKLFLNGTPLNDDVCLVGIEL
jgi:PAS domain S-box-containing protein